MTDRTRHATDQRSRPAAGAAPLLSVVIPVYNEGANIDWVTPELIQYLDEHEWTHEIVYVNDGSEDDSGERIRALMEKYPQIRYLAFSRNFGKEAATTAGIRAARGSAVITFDADGQFPCHVIGRFMAAWADGAKVVVGVRRSNSHEGALKRYGSRVFYRLLNMVGPDRVVPGSTDFRLIDRNVADAFGALTERNRLTRGLIDWLGFQRAYVTFDASARSEGRAAYDVRKLVRLALNAIVAQSTRPLLFTGVLGVFVTALAAVVGVFLIAERYVFHDPLHLAVTGTAILAVFLTFLVGVVLSCQGLLALYVESIHSETRNRPLYVLTDDWPSGPRSMP